MMRRWRQSLLVRLTLLFSLTAFVVLCVIGIMLTRSIDQHFLHLDQDILLRQLNTLRNVFNSLNADQDPRGQLADIINRHGAIAVILERDGALWSVEAGPALPDRAALDGREDFPLHWENSAGTYRGLRGVFHTNHPELPEGVIIVALETSVHRIFLTSFHRTMWLIIGIAALFIGFLGWVAARAVLLPLRHLITEASGVSADRLNMRLPVATLPSELKNLAQILNIMLERLEKSFTRLTDFSSDLAHELRTPLSNMKTQTQVALSHNRTLDEYRDILQSNAEELDQMARIVNDMLFLAKTDNGLALPRPESLDLTEEVKELFDFYEALADSRDIRLEQEGHGSLTGDKLMLRRAFGNLLGNAIAYSSPGTSVRVLLEQLAGGMFRIVVESHGETIPPEHLTRLFDRFYRIDAARGRSSDGAGLGLAITRSIILAHGGTVTIQSSHDVTQFIVLLPQAENRDAT